MALPNEEFRELLRAIREPTTGDPTQPTTWEDIKRAALTCPVLHAAVHQVMTGRASREEALLWAALWFSRERARMLEREADRLRSKVARREG